MPRKSAKPSSAIKRILTIDIGGTGLKAAIVGPTGGFLSKRLRVRTPKNCPPGRMVETLAKLVKPLTSYDHVSIGFPGYVRDGIVFTAPHLDDKDWKGFDLAAAMEKKLGRPARLHNDADVQGLAVISGKGLELVCTLGTGLGTAWFRDGELMPHMDLAHMAIHPKHDFDDYVGEHTRKRIGHKAWKKRVEKLIAMLNKVFFYDRLYLGGGNSRRMTAKLPKNVCIVSNDAGMEGGAFVWMPKGPKRRAPSARRA